jgi:hypothetical protein
VWCRAVWLKFSDLAEEYTASVFRIKKKAEQAFSENQISNRSYLFGLTFYPKVGRTMFILNAENLFQTT